MTGPDRERVLSSFNEGVEQIQTLTATLSSGDWSRPTPCPEWLVIDLVRHLQTTAARYHHLLDRALAGAPLHVVKGRDLAQLNATMLLGVSPLSGSDHIAEFVRLASTYAERLTPEVWDVQPYMAGWAASVGQVSPIKASEWHVHAWDIATVIGLEYRPSDPEALRLADDAWEAAMGRSPDRDDKDPWRAELVFCGRAPASTQP